MWAIQISYMHKADKSGVKIFSEPAPGHPGPLWGQCMYHYEDGNLRRRPANLPQPTQARLWKHGAKDGWRQRVFLCLEAFSTGCAGSTPWMGYFMILPGVVCCFPYCFHGFQGHPWRGTLPVLLVFCCFTRLILRRRCTSSCRCNPHAWSRDCRMRKISGLSIFLVGGFKYLFMFTPAPIWVRFPFWLIFFKAVETTN